MNVVYIPTRDRIFNLIKVIPAWLDQQFRVVLVVEPDEKDEHIQMRTKQGWRWDVDVIVRKEPDRGIGYARATAVRHASWAHHEAVIMSDDDVIPAKGSDMTLLVQEAAKPDVLAVGAWRQIYDLFTGKKIPPGSGVILCPGGWGTQMYGLNIEQALALGNYDEDLDCCLEDAELSMQGISAGIPWLVHRDVICGGLGGRYAPGGLSAYARTPAKRAERELACRQLVHSQWPEFTSEPGDKMRISWQKMLDHYISNWRTRSFIHGGQW